MVDRGRLTLRKIPTQERARMTVEAVIEATARILEKDGLEGLNTNEVARVAGVSIGSLYQYFPNKASLISELFLAQPESMLGALNQVVTTTDPASLVLLAEGIVNAMAVTWTSRGAVGRILARQALGGGCDWPLVTTVFSVQSHVSLAEIRADQGRLAEASALLDNVQSTWHAADADLDLMIRAAAVRVRIGPVQSAVSTLSGDPP
jgi:AcrR family transcriptional regulator